MKFDITEISNKTFYPLKTWAEESPGNWNMLLGIGLVLLLLGGILIFVFRKKMGKADERTIQISLRSTLIMLCGIVLCDVIFPKTYMWEIFFLYKYSLAFIASGIYLAVRYKKDFLN
ncbi:LPXTG cell wall anchor domain-containing protein [Paucisalibacillus sp. EB02]|uniref:LPXTG cell wall anchor domain-containing protein n=1 Tax=Paucisalibacillus sp. EB02 TaxID=1347087 RepID=UPI0005A75B0D|nr:LPXTG cell wall anchor domain-containing protein [Paucisalibacillus sp. EB02]